MHCLPAFRLVKTLTQSKQLQQSQHGFRRVLAASVAVKVTLLGQIVPYRHSQGRVDHEFLRHPGYRNGRRAGRLYVGSNIRIGARLCQRLSGRGI